MKLQDKENLDIASAVSDVLEGKKSLQEIIESVRPGIKMVLGSKSGSQMFANLDSKTQAGIVQLFSALEENFDYMIVDAKAGDDDSVLGYLVAAQSRLHSRMLDGQFVLP